MRARSLTLFAAILLVSVGLLAQNNLLVGTWKLNVAKSTFSPGPPLKSDTTTITAVPGGIRLVADDVDLQGQTTRNEYTVKFDGKDYPFKSTIAGKPNPNPSADTIAWKKIDDHTYETTAKLKGQVTTISHYVISQDGKTRTRTRIGKNAQGQPQNDTTVYEKK